MGLKKLQVSMNATKVTSSSYLGMRILPLMAHLDSQFNVLSSKLWWVQKQAGIIYAVYIAGL